MYCLSWTVSNPLWPLWAANSFFATESDAPHPIAPEAPHPTQEAPPPILCLGYDAPPPLTPCAPHLQSTSHLFVWLFSRPFTHLAQFFRMVILIMRQFQAMVEIWAQSDWCNGFFKIHQWTWSNICLGPVGKQSCMNRKYFEFWVETANIRAKLPAPPRPPGPGRHKHLYLVCNFRSLVAIFLDLDIWMWQHKDLDLSILALKVDVH